MSSSTSSSQKTKMIYDVFLSFMDEFQYARRGFCFHLRSSLQNEGLTVCRDIYGHRKQLLLANDVFGDLDWFPGELFNDNRHGKEEISSSLLQAIEGSRICIIIFSSAFAGSRWCLEEVEKIMECNRTIDQVVLPVFHNVEQWEVGEQSGTFGEAFEELIKGISVTQDKVLSWRRALTEATKFQGWHLTDCWRVESEIIDSICETITRVVESTSLFIAEHPVGVKSRVQDIIQLLSGGSNVLIVGILGMAGIGKTTIAKAVYNEIGHNFENKCFIGNINDVLKQDDAQVLQQQLLSDISNTETLRILPYLIRHGTEKEKIIMKQKLHRKRVLVVLDGVNQMDLFMALCTIKEWFGLGSRIIITARDEHLLNVCKVDHNYRMVEMNDSESLELFLWHAFGSLCPIDGADLLRNLVSHFAGLPLALEVFGSHLFGTLQDGWQSVICRLESIPRDQIQDKLKLCYDALDKSNKDIFLDISCFFIGKDRSYVTQILNDRGLHGEKGVRFLIEKKLLTVDKNKKLGMHDLLQKMGREIFGKKSKPKWIYNVFMSFGGEETRRSFASHLYAALTNAGIKVFMDNGLERGKNISASLMRAIESSKISIIIFSRSYAGSEWCLEELEKIMECHRTMHQEVLPIFYDVAPSEVRMQRGSFGEAFEELKETVSRRKIMVWRRALTEAANLSGWDMRKYRTEVELIDRIFETITMKLDDNTLFVAEHPVGIKSRMKDMIELLSGRSHNNVLIVGLWGMGGIGKTTIAKAIYNEIGRHFEGKSFLANISEIWEQENGKIDLQEQLLSDIMKRRMKLRGVDFGKILIKESLCHKRLLVVFDGVNKVDQLHALCGSREWFGQGSRLIITTRDEHLLNLLEVDNVFAMEALNEIESLDLFSWHAFKQKCPKDNFLELSRNVVAYSTGLPLALEILGSFLFGRGTPQWESTLEKLKKIPNDQIQKKLKISFDGLNDDTEKDIFLDISCFFIGMDRNYVTQILDECRHFAEIGISVLIERSLITVEKKNKLGMHDLLRDMGREIIREQSPKVPEERSRLWFHEDVLDVLKKHMGTKVVEGLALNMPSTNSVPLSTKAFKNMKRLRLLQLGYLRLDGDYKYFSRDLRWLCWHGFPLRFMPASFYQGSLVALDLKYSNVKLLWKEPKFLEKLKILNLSHSPYLTQTPDFSTLPNLEKLILKDCPSLSIVHHTIGDLNNLLLVNLRDCTCLVNLPRSIYKLKCLKTLILTGCSKIDKLVEDFEQMESLTILMADNTAIKQVPFSIVRSKSIAYISLCGHEGLSKDVFPFLIWSWMSPLNYPRSLETFGTTSSLVSVGLQDNCFHDLSSILNDLPKLRSLRVQCCPQHLLTQDVARILDAFNVPNCVEMEATANASQIAHVETSALIDSHNQVHLSRSENSLSSLLIQMGVRNNVTDTLREGILQAQTTNGSGDCFLPGDNYPLWLTYKGEGSSLLFKVPQCTGCTLKGMTLYILCSSDWPDKAASECLTYMLIINQTKGIIQLHKRDAITTFEWQGIISNLEPGDEVKVIVVFGNRFIVKNTTIYLVYGELMKKSECLSLKDKNAIFLSDDENISKNLTILNSKRSGCDDEEEASFTRSTKAKKM